jgi:TrpR-related protein YerC/YecD
MMKRRTDSEPPADDRDRAEDGQGTDGWRSAATDDLFATVLALRTPDEAERFFRDLCTLAELREMAQRWQVVRLLDEGRHYAEISRTTGVSTATITRIAQWLRHGEGGYRLALMLRPTARASAGPMPGARTASVSRTQP